MAIDLDSLIGGGTTLLAVPMTWWLTNRTTARAEARAERDALQAQFDQVALAIGELQGAAATNRLLWEGCFERLCTHVLVAMAAVGGWARSEGSELRRTLAGVGDAAHVLTQERRDSKLAAQRIEPFVTRLAAATIPLMRHPDTRIASASERVLTAAQQTGQPQLLESALGDLGHAVRAVVAPRPSLWARVWRRSRTGE